MVDRLIQCCYTNDDGWKSAAVSPAIPRSAYAFCTRFQVVNSDIPAAGWKTKDGDDLNLFELHGDDAFVYLCRTQYGLTDRMGRRSMFSHAFILPWSEALRDPNAFLTIANENFAADLETAEAPRAGVYLPRFTLGGALRDLGLERETYRTLLRAVYVQLVENQTSDPLYVACDGSDLQMRELLYCIYAGLPYHLRKRLNAASAATKAPERMQLIFSVDAASQRRRILPRTGEETVLTRRVVSRLERGGYIDHAPDRLAEELDAPGAFLRYFDGLASRAAALGGDGSDLTFRLAYRLLRGADDESVSDDELDLRLTEALRAKSRANGELNRYAAELLRAMTKRGMTLAQGASDLLWRRLEDAACSPALTDAAEGYYAALLERASPSEAAELLARMPEALAARYGVLLRKTGRGREILALRAWEQYRRALDDDDPAALAQYEALISDVLPQEEARARVAAAKAAYWDRMTFRRFSLDRREAYCAMETDCVRCRMFAAYAALLTARTADDGAYLADAARFFSSRGFGAALAHCASDERERAIALLVRAAGEAPRSVRLFPAWVALFARAGVDDRETAPLLALYRAVADVLACAGDALPSACDALCVAMDRLGGGDGDALRLVGDECRAADGAARPLTLDVWLTLGARRFGAARCCDIFDEEKPCVLRQKPATVVRQSARFAGSLRAARDYVARGGVMAQEVRRWLRAAGADATPLDAAAARLAKLTAAVRRRRGDGEG